MRLFFTIIVVSSLLLTVMSIYLGLVLYLLEHFNYL